jgi:FixJ family two-component response regulator
MKTSIPETPFIACVDDDVSVTEAIKDMLMALDLNATTYSSAEEFLISGQASHAACLITDVTMPGMSGFELMQRLASLGHAIPTIVIAGYANARTRAEAARAGAVCFLEKPVSRDELLACIQSALIRGHGPST